MNLKNRLPGFLPREYWPEIEKLSKAALMDIVWDMAKQLTPSDDDDHEAPDSDVIGTIRCEVEIWGDNMEHEENTEIERHHVEVARYKYRWESELEAHDNTIRRAIALEAEIKRLRKEVERLAG